MWTKIKQIQKNKGGYSIESKGYNDVHTNFFDNNEIKDGKLRFCIVEMENRKEGVTLQI